MSAEQNDTSAPRSGTTGVMAPAPSYDPPSIAWEEVLEPTMATTCAVVPLDPGCGSIPTT